MSVLFTFPGQGSQIPGMLHNLPEHPEVSRVLGDAGAVLGFDPLTLDAHAALQGTRAVQLSLLIAGVAMARVVSAYRRRPDMVAGFSVGAFAAAVVAGSLEFADALSAVDLRGRLMAAAFPHGYGMAAVIGLDRSPLEALVAEIHGECAPLYVANINAERKRAGAAHATQF